MDLFTYTEVPWDITPDKKAIRKAIKRLIKPGSQWAEFIKKSSELYSDPEIDGMICEAGKE